MTLGRLFLTAVILLSIGTRWSAAQAPVGPEFQANGVSAGDQRLYGVASDAAGNFIVMWEGDGQLDVFARRYDANGNPLGGEFQLNAYSTGFQENGSVAMAAAGNFIAVWDDDARDGSDIGVFGQRFNSSGAPVGADFQVNTYTTYSQGVGRRSIAVDGAGNFLVVWVDNDRDGSTFGLYGRAFDANAMALSADFQVNTYTTARQILPTVATNAAGNFVVIWQSEGQDGSGFGVFGKRYTSSGTPIGGEFQVNTYTTGVQGYASAAVTPTGSFLVVWAGQGQESGFGVRGRLYDAGGVPASGEFAVNTYTPSDQGISNDVAIGADGNYIVTWQSTFQDGHDFSVFAQRLDGTGAKLGPEFQVNTYTTLGQKTPLVAPTAAGSFVVAWRSYTQDGDGYGVFAQRFVPARYVLGKKMIVKDPAGAEDSRVTLILGKETATDIGAIVGDPTASGATLRVRTKGAAPSDQTYLLDAAGWSATATGFRYTGPTGGDGDPVRKVILKRTPGGTALIKVLLKGNVGTQSLDVVPPFGALGGLVLAINGGDSYCVSLGSSTGASTLVNTAQMWKTVNAIIERCPAP